MLCQVLNRFLQNLAFELDFVHVRNVCVALRIIEELPPARTEELTVLKFQGVQMCTIYTRPERMAHPEIVIHFQEPTKPSTYIPVEAITSLQITND